MIIQANSRQKKGVQKLSEGSERFFALLPDKLYVNAYM